MIHKRIQLIIVLLVATLLLGACDQADTLTEQADVSQIEDAVFYDALQGTVARVQIPVLFLGIVNLLGGWKFGRFGLAINGLVIGGLMIFTYLDTATFKDDISLLQDENMLIGISAVGGALVGILTFFLYNLMSLIIGGVIGTTLMGGAWLQVADNVPPQILVFLTTFVSAMVMFFVFRIFLVAFSAVIGAALLMLGVPFETLWVVPVGVVGILIQSGIAWWIGDDIFSNLRGDMRAAMGESFAEVLGPLGILRDRQRGNSESASSAHTPRQRRRRSSQAEQQPQSQPQQQYQNQYQQPPAQQYQQPYQSAQQYQQQQYQSPPPQPYNVPSPQQQYKPPPVRQHAAPKLQSPPQAQEPIVPPIVPNPPASTAQTQPHLGEVLETQQSMKPKVNHLHITLSDGQTFPVEGGQITVGRSPDNQIVVNDPQVSGRHLTFAIQSEGIVVWDNQSTNGSYLNGERLQGSHQMTIQDELRIGAIILRLADLSDVESTQAHIPPPIDDSDPPM